MCLGQINPVISAVVRVMREGSCLCRSEHAETGTYHKTSLPQLMCIYCKVMDVAMENHTYDHRAVQSDARSDNESCVGLARQ